MLQPKCSFVCFFFQPRTEMRREFLEIVQDRLQGDPLQLHTETVPHASHKGARLQYQFIFNFFAPFFAFCCMCLNFEVVVTSFCCCLICGQLWSDLFTCPLLFNCGCSRASHLFKLNNSTDLRCLSQTH